MTFNSVYDDDDDDDTFLTSIWKQLKRHKDHNSYQRVASYCFRI